jgi:type II secretory pathway pseudopilin PulG
MRNKQRHRGFSLTEVLLAVGTLAIGMIFIGGTFLTGIHLTTITTERTVAAVIADEAFAKVRLYGIDLADPNLMSDQVARFETLNPIAPSEFAYPSTKSPTDKQFYWSALCRPAGSDPTGRLVQVTVFVSRKVGTATTYPGGASRPIPVPVGVSVVAGVGNESRLTITNQSEQAFINGGSTIVDGQTGLLYRVLQRDADAPNTFVLEGNWRGAANSTVWVVPPPIGGGKYPCIAVYQKLIAF